MQSDCWQYEMHRLDLTYNFESCTNALNAVVLLSKEQPCIQVLFCRIHANLVKHKNAKALPREGCPAYF